MLLSPKLDQNTIGMEMISNEDEDHLETCDVEDSLQHI
jgi:hypothetical protein